MLSSLLTFIVQGVRSFVADEEGASAIEYGLIIGLIAVALVIVLGLVGTDLSSLFQSVSDTIPSGSGGG